MNRHGRWHLIWFVLGGACPAGPIHAWPASATAAPEPGPAAGGERLVVLARPLTAQDVPPALAATIDAVIVGELGRRPGLRLTTLAALQAALDLERMRDLLGCDEVGCSVELAGALGADRIVSGSLGRLGARYVLGLQWIDALYGTVLATSSLAVASEDALLAAANQALAQLLGEAAGEDELSRQRKARPTFWTAELAVGAAFVHGIEPYRPGLALDAAVSWGGRAGGRAFYYLVGGLSGGWVGGQAQRLASGQVSYQCLRLEPLLGLRAAYPLGYRDRLRAYAGAALGLQWERGAASQDGGLATTATSLTPCLHLPVGLWYRWQHRHAVVAGYRLRLGFRGAGADPLSELVASGTSRGLHVVSELEVGWALHW